MTEHIHYAYTSQTLAMSGGFDPEAIKWNSRRYSTTFVCSCGARCTWEYVDGEVVNKSEWKKKE